MKRLVKTLEEAKKRLTKGARFVWVICPTTGNRVRLTKRNYHNKTKGATTDEDDRR